MFTRPLVIDSGLARPARAGDGLMANLLVASMAVDAASTITAANIAGGAVLRTNATAGRVDTTDTAANILAAFPSMDVGDSYVVLYSNQSVSTITFGAGAGVTLSGQATVAAGSKVFLTFVKTAAATMNCVVL